MMSGKGRGDERLPAYSKGDIGVGVYLGERWGKEDGEFRTGDKE